MKKYEVEDTVYISIGDSELSRGKVVAVLNLKGYFEEQYVIEIETEVGSLLEVRNYLTISDTKEGPLNWEING